MSKNGRNDSCLCGSGRKYKKCCLSRDVIIPQKPVGTHKPEKILVKTLTDELFQPMRLYYIVHNRDQLEARFRNLKCFEYNKNLNDWTVEYSNESANIGLKVKPEHVPKAAQPLIIATIYIENDTTMLVDVRSIERASKLIEFLDSHIPKALAEITHAAIYNRLITVSGDRAEEGISDIDFDDIFNQKNVFVVDPEKAFRDAEQIAEKYDDKDARLRAMIRKTEEEAKKPLPMVEKFPAHYYEDGIKSFSMSCQMRQVIAMKHYYGDVNYSFYDLTREFFGKNMDKLQGTGGWVKQVTNRLDD